MPKTKSFNREEVLDKAMHLFWLKGYHATSMQDLVDEMGLNRSSIYNSFGDKHNLFSQAIERYQKLEKARTQNILLESASPKEAIKNLFQTFIQEIIDSKENRGCFISNSTCEVSSTDRTLHTFLSKNLKEMEEFLGSLLENARVKNEISSNIDSKQYASFLVSSLQGLKVTSMLNTNRTYLEGIVEEILRFLEKSE